MINGRKALMLALLLAAAPACALAQAPPESLQGVGGQPPAPGSQGQVAGSAVAPHPVPWSSLSPQQQRLLGPVANRWGSLPPARQQALVRGSERWLQMNPAQRSMARQRFQQWRRLTPQQRQTLRQRWQ